MQACVALAYFMGQIGNCPEGMTYLYVPQPADPRFLIEIDCIVCR